MLDRPETIVADKRISRWSEKDQAWLDTLTWAERYLVRMLAAYLDARPVGDSDGS